MYLPEPETLSRVYGEKAGEAATRFRSLSARFSECFGGASPAGFFSSPGRAEIIGNHVDHNGGQVLAASITLDTICCAAPNNEGRVRIFSEGYHDPIDIRVSSLGDVPRCRGSLSLTAGLIDGLLREGFRCAGFDACVSSNVIPSAGVSSSASYEMLIATVISELFNDGRLTLSQKAHAGQYAENVWWEKASGLMDQMACAHGGTVLFDFKDEVTAEPVDFTFDDIGCDMILVNSGKGHADLSREYSSVPGEMHYIASLLHKNNLSETTCEDILSLLTKRAQTDDACDRAFLRALH